MLGSAPRPALAIGAHFAPAASVGAAGAKQQRSVYPKLHAAVRRLEAKRLRQFLRVVAMVTLALSSACRDDSSSERVGGGGGKRGASDGYEHLHPCEEGEGLCGMVSVPLDHAAAGGERLELALRVWPARSPGPEAEALYVLVGGPGQAATEVGPRLAPALQGINRAHDLVFVDQRGTGRADKPASLHCKVRGSSLSEMFSTEFPEGKLRACLASFAHSPRYFDTEASVADLELVRAQLGHARIHLFGLSYGTRLALAYMRRHANRVASAVLDGVAPPQLSLASAMDRGAHEVLERTFSACAADAECELAFGNLRERFDNWLDAIEEIDFQVQLQHPRLGSVEAVSLEPAAVLSVVRSAGYSPDASSLLPLALDRLMKGRPEALVGLASVGEGVGDSVSLGLFLSIVCAEDMRHVDEVELDWARDQTRRGGEMFDELEDVCEFWPSATPPDDFAEPVRAGVPVLLLSGELDPATPPAWAELAAESLSRSHSIVVPGAGHGTWAVNCVPELIRDFIASDGTGPIERSCVEAHARPPFFIDEAGPAFEPEALEPNVAKAQGQGSRAQGTP